MENVNMWTKLLPLITDKNAWKLHSPNVVATKKCYIFEHIQVIRNSLKNDDYDVNQSKSVPEMVEEKGRLYEWLVSLLKIDIPGRMLTRSMIDESIKNLKN